MATQSKREGFQPDEPPEDRRDDHEDTPVIDMATGEVMPQPAPETWPLRVKLLRKPIRNNKNDEINEIAFREPTGADINRYGNPVRINADGDIVIDEIKMTRIMGQLAGIAPPLIERMDPRDWNSCAYRLRSFFLPDPLAWA